MNVFTTQRLYIRFKRMLPVLLFSMADPALAQESGDHQYTAEAIQSGYYCRWNRSEKWIVSGGSI